MNQIIRKTAAIAALGVGIGAGAKMWIALAVGLTSLVVFGVRQVRLARTDAALLDLRVFRTKSFAISTAILSVGMLAMFGVIIILPLYLALRGVEIPEVLQTIGYVSAGGAFGLATAGNVGRRP